MSDQELRVIPWTDFEALIKKLVDESETLLQQASYTALNSLRRGISEDVPPLREKAHSLDGESVGLLRAKEILQAEWNVIGKPLKDASAYYPEVASMQNECVIPEDSQMLADVRSVHDAIAMVSIKNTTYKGRLLCCYRPYLSFEQYEKLVFKVAYAMGKSYMMSEGKKQCMLSMESENVESDTEAGSNEEQNAFRCDSGSDTE